MKIDISIYPNCTWILEDGEFHCTHDDVVVLVFVEEVESFGAMRQLEREVYVCSECGDQQEGDPVADRQDAIAEMQLMEILNK